MRFLFLCSLVFVASAAGLDAQETVSVRTADGFQCPVGPNGSGEGFYIARGYLPNGHLGDDWNGIRGGDTDFGEPVSATAHGLVVFAKNYHVGWGNVVIIRHAYYEGSALRFADSLYGHLADFNVVEGQQVRRGQLIGHIGSNNGMYDAHLHFELRKNINIGMYRGSYPRDFTNYWSPNKFLATHGVCPGGNKLVAVPVNTFPATAPPSYVANKVSTPMYTPTTAPASHLPTASRLPQVASATSSAPSRSSSVALAEKRAIPEIAAAPEKTRASAEASALPRKTSAAAGAKTARAEKETPATAKKTTKTPKALAEEIAQELARGSSKPSALEVDSYEPESTPSSGSPIRRSQPNFRVDRFQDLRGQGY